ncbi:hypothetical protein IA69_00395 [Massilia sp. JS1662]|nr:hypothetical protein [Massilia sp. JS1662]KGF83312.1 hypothetical protein IA69_00395 [Massilia sp. JS1662]
MSFFARYARFLSPACFLFLAATRIVDAVRSGATADWLAGAAFAGVAVMLYLTLGAAHRKRLAEAGRDGSA